MMSLYRESYQELSVLEASLFDQMAVAGALRPRTCSTLPVAARVTGSGRLRARKYVTTGYMSFFWFTNDLPDVPDVLKWLYLQAGGTCTSNSRLDSGVGREDMVKKALQRFINVILRYSQFKKRQLGCI